MMTSKMRVALFATTTMLFALPAMAQDQSQSAPTTDQAAPPADDIIVTGSRIRRPDYEAPNPIV